MKLLFVLVCFFAVKSFAKKTLTSEVTEKFGDSYSLKSLPVYVNKKIKSQFETDDKHIKNVIVKKKHPGVIIHRETSTQNNRTPSLEILYVVFDNNCDAINCSYRFERNIDGAAPTRKFFLTMLPEVRGFNHIKTKVGQKKYYSRIENFNLTLKYKKKEAKKYFGDLENLKPFKEVKLNLGGLQSHNARLFLIDQLNPETGKNFTHDEIDSPNVGGRYAMYLKHCVPGVAEVLETVSDDLGPQISEAKEVSIREFSGLMRLKLNEEQDTWNEYYSDPGNCPIN